MKKIKKMSQLFFYNFKNPISRYPVTTVLIGLVSVFACVFIDQSGTLGKFMEDKGLPFTMLWGVGTYFVETLWCGKKKIKYPGIVLTALIAAGFIYAGSHGSELVQETASHLVTAYVIVLISLGVYRNYRNSGLAFNEYCIRVIHELSRLVIICAIIALGIALIMAVFVTLILNGEHFMLILRAEFLVLGFLVGSGLLNAQISPDRELPRFFTVIVKYVLMVLLLTAFVVIYGYILKIIITRVVPSNEIFRILAGLFIIGLPIWTMIGTCEPEHILVRIGTKLPYIFIPFLFLQGYAIRERILAYGITPLRYLCIALMVFEVIYIIVYAARKMETGIMLPVIAGLAVICLVLPVVNMFSVSNRSQKAIFDRYIASDFASLSNSDQSSLAGAYYYLAGNAEGKAMLSGIDEKKIETIKASGKIGNAEFDQNLYIYYEFPVKNADISGYSRMTLVSTFAADNKQPEFYDPEKIDFYDSEGNVILSADLREFINACISSWAANPGGTPDMSSDVALPDGSLLRIYRCSFNIEPDQVIRYLHLDAVLLSEN